jgi:hypothetical protein
MKNSVNVGIDFLLIALACFAFLDTITKQILLTVPVLMVIWIRFVVQALLTSVFMLPRTGRRVLETRKPYAQLIRGALLIIRPGGNAFGWGVVFSLMLVAANTIFQLLTSKITLTEKSTTTHFYSVWIGALLSTLQLIWGWVPITDAELWMRLILIGAAGAIGHFPDAFQ